MVFTPVKVQPFTLALIGSPVVCWATEIAAPVAAEPLPFELTVYASALEVIVPPATFRLPARTSMPNLSPSTVAFSATLTVANPLREIPAAVAFVTEPLTLTTMSFSVFFRLPRTNSVPSTLPFTFTSMAFFCSSLLPNTFRP